MSMLFGSSNASENNTADSGLIKDSSIETFEQDVIAASMHTPVIVDFWATWCGPCKQLTPALEKAVKGANGSVKLVKIDIDKNQMLATQLRIQSVPTVYAFYQGQPVDGFMGAVPDSELKAFIARLEQVAASGAGGDPAQPAEDDPKQILEQAGQAFEAGDLATAAQFYAAIAQQDADNVEALAGLAKCYAALGELERAKTLLESAPEGVRDDEAFASVKAAIELADGAANPDEIRTLLSALEANPGDHEKRFALANALIAAGQMDEGVDQLLILLEKDRQWNEEAARKKLLTVFEALGAGHHLVKTGRRRLSSLLFS